MGFGYKVWLTNETVEHVLENIRNGGDDFSNFWDNRYSDDESDGQAEVEQELNHDEIDE